jgi:3-oxoacyl-(acyl-carrier-protein) synthase
MKIQGPPTNIDYIIAYDTYARLKDQTETKPIKKVFGEHANKLAINSSKSMIGNAIGPSCTLEAIPCVMNLLHGIIQPRLINQRLTLNVTWTMCIIRRVSNLVNNRNHTHSVWVVKMLVFYYKNMMNRLSYEMGY